MHPDQIEQLLKTAAGATTGTPSSKARANAMSFLTRPHLRVDPHAATEATIFIHGYSAGHSAEDRRQLLDSIPASTAQHARIFGFWNSSHFSRFNRGSRRLIQGSYSTSVASLAAFVAADRVAHFAKIRRRADELGSDLFNQLQSYLLQSYPNVEVINLVGHSLGGRMIFSALKSLVGSNPQLRINDVMLMAAAVEVQPDEVRYVRQLVRGRLINAYSLEDWTLFLPLDENCLGRREVLHFENIRIDGFGHSDYWKKLPDVLVRTEFGERKLNMRTEAMASAEPEVPPITHPTTTTMTLEFDTPSEIYQRINSELIRIVGALEKPTHDAVLDKAQADARERLTAQQIALQRQLAELESNAEWDKFTIAFYGETGAGKSTLVETLRILLQDPGKLASQQAFRELRDQCAETDTKSRQLLHDMHGADARLEMLEAEAQSLLQRHEPECLSAQQAVDEAEVVHEDRIQQFKTTLDLQEAQMVAFQHTVTRLEELLAKRKQTLTMWQKVLGVFRKAPEEIELAEAHDGLLSATKARDEASAIFDTRQKEALDHKRVLVEKLRERQEIRDAAIAAVREQQAEIRRVRSALSSHRDDVAARSTRLLADMKNLADGDIIGDGRADFTREARRYDLQLAGQPFTLLDVPGIEGKEELVVDEIRRAVQRAHAVFYVTNQAAPPQTGEGEEHRKGTLEKIREHLGAQTEVWALFNKKVTNAKLALADRPLTSSDEDASLKALDEKMQEHLGTRYRQTLPLSALPAFLASTDHLLPDSQHARRREKMLTDFSSEDLLEKSRLSELLRLLDKQLLRNAREKIIHSNLNKARHALDQTTATTDDLHRSLAELSTELDRDGEGAQSQLRSSFDALRQRLDARGATLIAKFSSDARTKIYERIDTDISDREFKDELTERIEKGAKKLGKRLPEALAEEVEVFRSDVDDIIKRFEEQARELTGIHTRLGSSRLKSNINFKVNIDNGVNVLSLMGGIVGLVLAPFTGGASLWVTGLASLSVVISLGKAVYKIFSTDYKKSQQRKASDESLRNASEQLRDSLNGSLKKSIPKIRSVVRQLEQALGTPGLQAAAQAETLKQSVKRMKALSLKIGKAGTF